MARLATRRRTWIVGALLLLVAACGIAGWIGWRALASNPLLAGDTESLSSAEIESIGRIKLPPSAAGIQASAGGFQDRFISIRFDMEPADLEEFLLGTRYMPAISPTAELPFQALGQAPPWWRPQDAQRFAAGTSFVDGISQAVLVDLTNTERYTVYIQTFET